MTDDERERWEARESAVVEEAARERANECIDVPPAGCRWCACGRAPRMGERCDCGEPAEGT